MLLFLSINTSFYFANVSSIFLVFLGPMDVAIFFVRIYFLLLCHQTALLGADAHAMLVGVSKAAGIERKQRTQ